MAYVIDIMARARADIVAGVAFRVQRNSAAAAAAQWHDRVLEAVHSLSVSPERCPFAEESHDLGLELRELMHGNRKSAYRILFFIDGSMVHIVRIRHAAQARLTAQDL